MKRLRLLIPLSLTLHLVLALSRSIGVDPIALPLGAEVSAFVSDACQVVVFLDPACHKCDELMKRDDLWTGAETWVLPDGELAQGAVLASGFSGKVVFDKRLFDEFHIRAVPAVAIVQSGRLVAAGAPPSSGGPLDRQCLQS